MIRTKPLKSGTKRMRQGRSTGKPTKAEEARIVASKEGPCMACEVWHEKGNAPHGWSPIYGCDYNHCTSEKIRDYIKAHQPISPRDVASALGLKYRYVCDSCRPMVRREILSCDDMGRYMWLRDAKPKSAKRAHPTDRTAAERERLKRRTDKMREERAARGLIGSKAKEARANETRRSIRVEAAQAIHLRENGLHAFVSPPAKVESVADFLARGGKVQMLAQGVVSESSRFQRIEVLV